MARKFKEGSLTGREKRIVKALLGQGERNQDIQALLNIGRVTTVNGARITEVKQHAGIIPAKDGEVAEFRADKKSYDARTDLSLYSDERLIRAREAMILAVQVFNSPNVNFKTEVFSVLSNIAWTYLLHEYYERKGVRVIDKSGMSLFLSKMLRRKDCPLSQGVKDNLNSLKEIRDAVEHTLFRRSDVKFLSIFQACCLNFDKYISEFFGEEKTLKHDLSFSLQFAKMDFEQLSNLQSYDVPEKIEALDKQLSENLSVARESDLEYRFRVVYTLENSTKSKAHFKFVHPESESAEEIKNVLIKHEVSDKMWPHLPSVAEQLIARRSGRRFTSRNHQQAWKKFKARPNANAKSPTETNREWCTYHEAWKRYTYSDKWIDFIVEYISSDSNYENLKKFRL